MSQIHNLQNLTLLVLLLFHTAVAQQTTSTSTTQQTTSTSTAQQTTSISSTQQTTLTSTTQQMTPTTADISQLTAVPITWNIGAYNIAVYSSNKPDAITQTNPTFNNLTMAFGNRLQTDCQAGSAYGNPNVRDENLGYRSDYTGCMSECVRMNLEMTPYNVGEDPVCTGFVFFDGGDCLIKVGLLESSACYTNNTATAFFLHLV